MRIDRDVRRTNQHPSHIHHRHILRGSSAGSMICLVSCLKDEYRTFEWIANTAETICDIHSKTGGIPNMRVIVEEFVGQLIRAADPDKLKYCFDNRCLEIQISRVTCCGLKPEIVSPTSINELMELVVISCTIPLISRNLNPCDPKHDFQLCCVRRRSDNSSWCCATAYVDGRFVEYCGSTEPADTVIPVKHRTIVIPSREWCERVWREGMEWDGTSSSATPPTSSHMNRV